MITEAQKQQCCKDKPTLFKRIILKRFILKNVEFIEKCVVT